MSSLEELRAEIDRIDGELVRLLNRRADLAREVGAVKRAQGDDLYVPSREQEVLAKVCALNDGPLPDHQVAEIYRTIMTASLSLEGIEKVLVLDAPGVAAAVTAYVGRDVSCVLSGDPGELLAAWGRGGIDYAAWPVELEGPGPWSLLATGQALVLGCRASDDGAVILVRRPEPNPPLKQVHIGLVTPKPDPDAWRALAGALADQDPWWGGQAEGIEVATPMLMVRVHEGREAATLSARMAPWVDALTWLHF